MRQIASNKEGKRLKCARGRVGTQKNRPLGGAGQVVVGYNVI